MHAAATKPTTAVNMLVGSYYAQYLAGGSFPDDWPEAVVDTILGGLALS